MQRLNSHIHYARVAVKNSKGTDFGLPGGKVEEGETLYHAAKRETFEETGLDVTVLHRIFSRQNGDFMVTTFMSENYYETLKTEEEGVVKWVDPCVVARGSFGDYNKALFDWVGISYDERNMYRELEERALAMMPESMRKWFGL